VHYFQDSLTWPFLSKVRLRFAAVVALLTVVVFMGGSEGTGHISRHEILQNLVDRFALAAIKETPIDQYRRCPSLLRPNARIPSRFTLAILAVENYGRPPFQRWVKAVAAHASLAVLGKLPNFSLGIGQLKPSTARLVLGEVGSGSLVRSPSESELLRDILNPCQNIGLVVRYLAILRGAHEGTEFDRQTAEGIIRAYNGQRFPTWDGWLYQQVVWKIYETLQ
jgi:hypothetical protein